MSDEWAYVDAHHRAEMERINERADPRFPDSERCNECGVRFPMADLVGDDDNGGWLCAGCRGEPSSPMKVDDGVTLMTILNAERYEMLCEFYGDETIQRALARIQAHRAKNSPAGAPVPAVDPSRSTPDEATP